MLRKLRQHLTYANAMATIAVFVALGGSSYAALQISSRDIVDDSVRGRDVRDGSLTYRDVRRNSLDGRAVKESRLGRVPRAKNADQLGGLLPADFKLRCAPGTLPVSDVCVETAARPAAPYGTALRACADSETPQTPGRRLPTHGELTAALAGVPLAPGGELTSNVYPSSSDPGGLDVLYVTDSTGRVGTTPNTGTGAKAFRCVADPLN